MRKLYEKNELTFSLIWIIGYVVLVSVADSVSLELGTAKIITVPVCLLIAIFLRSGLQKMG